MQKCCLPYALHPGHPSNVHLTQVLLRRGFRDKAVHLHKVTQGFPQPMNRTGKIYITGGGGEEKAVIGREIRETRETMGRERGSRGHG